MASTSARPLLAATAGVALCQVNVRTNVEEDYVKRVTLFPTFQVPPSLRNLIPLEKGLPNNQQMRWAQGGGIEAGWVPEKRSPQHLLHALANSAGPLNA